MRATVFILLVGWLTGAAGAQSSPPDCSKICVDKSIIQIAVEGSAGAAAPGAQVLITDKDGDTAQGTAGDDGSFCIPAGHLDLAACNDLLASQKEGEEDWSKSCSFHSDPPLVDFATPDWETVYARYLYTHGIDEVSVNGRWMLVRPRAQRISPVREDGSTMIRGAGGALDGGAVAQVALADGRTFLVSADAKGRFEADLSGHRSGTVLVSEILEGRVSRTATVVADRERIRDG